VARVETVDVLSFMDLFTIGTNTTVGGWEGLAFGRLRAGRPGAGESYCLFVCYVPQQHRSYSEGADRSTALAAHLDRAPTDLSARLDGEAGKRVSTTAEIGPLGGGGFSR
jgi:hypothetical protein